MIPSILDFCYFPDYLNLRSQGITLYPVQSLMLRAFYRGTEGNLGNLFHTDDLSLCSDLCLNDYYNGNILSKVYSGEIFNELLLIWGRNTGKDLICSIIVAYETLKAIESKHVFNIILVKYTVESCDIMLDNIRHLIYNSPYFRNKIYSDNRRRRVIELSNNYNITISAVSSMGYEYRGRVCDLMVLNDFASYDDRYLDLRGMAKFDSKTIITSCACPISDSSGLDTPLYQLYNSTDITQRRLMCRLPTYLVTNYLIQPVGLPMSGEIFDMEYNAEFKELPPMFFSPVCGAHNWNITNNSRKNIEIISYLRKFNLVLE